MKEEKKEQEVATNQVADTEIQDEELDKVNGGFILRDPDSWCLQGLQRIKELLKH